jgi:hypothetical protein
MRIICRLRIERVSSAVSAEKGDVDRALSPTRSYH